MTAIWVSFLLREESNEQPCSQGKRSNLVPRVLHTKALVPLFQVKGPDKGWLSHYQIFQNSWKIFLPNYRVFIFCNKFCKYIGKFGHVTSRRCRAVHHMPPHKEALGTTLGNKIPNGFSFQNSVIYACGQHPKYMNDATLTRKLLHNCVIK